MPSTPPIETERLGMSPLRSDKLLGDPVTVWATERR